MRNTPTGKVEGEAQGSDEGIAAFLKDLGRGPVAARVVRVERGGMGVEGEGEGVGGGEEGKGEGGFEIRG